MALSSTCPACGHQQTAPGSVHGPVVCASCNQTYEVTAAPPTSRSSATKAALVPTPSASSGPTPSVAPRPATIAGRPTVRPPGSPPELLDRLPKPFMTSPPMIALGAVFVLLYGMVAFGVVTNLNNRPEPTVVVSKGQEFAPIGAPIPKPSGDAVKTPETSPKNAEPSKTEKTDETPKDRPARDKDKPAPTIVAKNDAKKPDDKPKPADMQVARVSTPAPTLTPKKAEGPKQETWGLLHGVPGDCQFEANADGLALKIPGSLHVLSPEIKLFNAPHLLTDAGGDFTAMVKAVGRISPGNVPLALPLPPGEKPKDEKQVPRFPFTFQGTGLLIWHDQGNYIQLQRSARFYCENSKRIPMVLLEHYQNGQSVGVKEIPAKDKETIIKDGRPTRQERDVDLTLRIVRIGSEFRCSYSPDDGKTWLEVKRLQAPSMPPTVKVGVTAVNVSEKEYVANLQGFELTANAK